MLAAPLFAFALTCAAPADPAAAPHASVSVALAVQPAVGLADDEVAHAQEQLTQELAGLGAVVVTAQPVDPACVPDPACIDNARGAAPALLVVELLRVGPVVQLTATAAAAGAHRATGTHGLDEAQFSKGPLLPDAVRTWVKELAPVAPPPPPPPPKEKPIFNFTGLQSGGLFAGGVGAIALLAGAVLVATSEPVLEDKASPAAQKEQAVTFGWIGVGAATIGAVALAAGGVLFFLPTEGGAPAAE